MTVEQLISKLQDFPQDFEVLTSDNLEDGYNFEVRGACVASLVHDEDCQGGKDCFCEALEVNPDGGVVVLTSYRPSEEGRKIVEALTAALNNGDDNTAGVLASCPVPDGPLSAQASQTMLP